MAQTTLIARKGQDADFADVTVDTLSINGNSIAGGLALGNGEVVDLQGEADALVLDADNDTTISAPTDDQIDVEIAGADDFRFTANTFTALSGSTIATNTIAETTAGSGVTVDSLLVKDGGVVAAGALDANGQEVILDADADTSITADTDDQIDIKVSGADDFQITANTLTALSGSTIKTDTIAETTGGAGITADGVLLKDGGIVCADAATLEVDTINEATSAAGITIDGALLKDGRSNLGRQVQALTESGAITIKSGLVTLAHDTVVIAATLAAPTAGDELIIVDASAAGTAAHTVTVAGGVTFDGTNNTAPLNAPGEALHLIALSATRWFILENIGSVALSSV